MTPQSVRVTEIFHSIQGESTWAGLPCTFVRLTGCPLRCVWCDTAYAFHGGTRMSIVEVVETVAAKRCRLVEITGGEPLVQPGAATLASRLLDDGFTVLVETSGAVDVSVLDDRVHTIMDLKCPGSGEADRNLWTNLDHLTERDEVKFVVSGRDDFEWAADVIRRHGLDERVRAGTLGALLVSPVWGLEEMEELATAILASGLPVRFQTQLHKHIWGPDRAGV
ncbi:MAG: radical SAM protein [Gemmatimonadota bacterium]|nr:radical SAM protein [Gemmatimonadota bacterium]